MNQSSRLNSIRATDCVPAKAVGLDREAQDNELALMRADLRDAIEESRWKHEALAVEMSRASGLTIDGPYLSKILSGEKPLTAAHLAALPNAIEDIYNRIRTERSGQLVVAPLEGDAAVRGLMGGIFGLLNRRRA